MVSPVIWQPFIEEAIVEKQNLISMGLVNVSNYPFAGKYFPRPVQNHYEDIADSTLVDDTVTLTPETWTDYQENIVACSRGHAIYGTTYDTMIRGNDGIKTIGTQIIPVVTNLIQTSLVSATSGVFSTALASTHYVDNSAVGDGLPTIGNIEKAIQSKMGENMLDFDTMIVSSNHFAYLNEKYAMMQISSDNAGPTVTYRGDITMLGRYKVMINDTLCAAESGSYPIFLVGGKPWQLYWQKNISIGTDFDLLTGAGKDILAWYTSYAPAISGVSWTHTSYNPTDAQLATAGYWTAVGNAKHTKLVKVLYTGAS